MCERRGMGDGQGASWEGQGTQGGAQEAQDIMCIQYVLYKGQGRGVQGADE
jgi:hypothetical protein